MNPTIHLKKPYIIIKTDLSLRSNDVSKYTNQKNGIHYIDRMKNKNHDYHNRCSKSIWQNSTSIHDKILNKPGIWEIYHNIIKAMHDKPTANILLDDEKFE